MSAENLALRTHIIAGYIAGDPIVLTAKRMVSSERDIAIVLFV